MIEKILINNARTAMLENICALDKKTLQRELESHLKLEFKYKDEVDKLKNIIDEFNRLYCDVIKKCDHVISNRNYLEYSTVKFAHEVKDMCHYHVYEAKRLEEVK